MLNSGKVKLIVLEKGAEGVQSNNKISVFAFASIGRGGEIENGFCAPSCFPGHILESHGDVSLGEVVGCGEVVDTHTW